MQTSVDKFGRVLIPKAMREHLGLHPGSILEIQECDHEISLKVLEEEPTLKLEHGILVFTGKPLGDVDNAVNSIRTERLNRVEDL